MTLNQYTEICLRELFSRIPDLQKDYEQISDDIGYASINQMSYNSKDGFKAKVREAPFRVFKDHDAGLGYTITCDGQWCAIACDAKTFADSIPLFVHAYIQKTFGAIPSLFIAEPFSGNRHYSQLCITYMVAYVLGC